MLNKQAEAASAVIRYYESGGSVALLTLIRNLSITLGGAIPNHCHDYTNPWEKVAVFVTPQECPRCPK